MLGRLSESVARGSPLLDLCVFVSPLASGSSSNSPSPAESSDAPKLLPGCCRSEAASSECSDSESESPDPESEPESERERDDGD